MVWCSRQDRMGDMPDLWPLLPFQGCGTSLQEQTLFMVDNGRFGCRSGPLRMDRLSFPT
jgi:hypothetical protein